MIRLPLFLLLLALGGCCFVRRPLTSKHRHTENGAPAAASVATPADDEDADDEDEDE